MRSILHLLAHGTEKRLRPTIAIAGILVLPPILNSGFSAELNVPAKYAAIQEAVDAASDGDTIRIAPGIYTNQVTIEGKKLTLIGQPGTILRATEALSLAPGPGENSFPILYIRLSEVTLRGLIFEGEGLAGSYEGPGELRGVLLRGSSATVESCAFYGFRERTPGNEDAIAISASGSEAGQVNVRLTDCTFADNYLSLYVIGSPDRRNMNITIENNTIIGPGPLDRRSPTSGINIREGVGGRIAGNTISGFSYIGTAADVPISFGIEASHQANYPEFGILELLEIEGNILRDNQVHISLVKADGSTVKNNRFQGSAPGIIPLGLAVSGTNVTVANNQFEDMPEGIRLFGDDPTFGEGVGFALNAEVASNRFCNVTKPVNKQRLATMNESGTLSCPFPAPVLDLAPAVVLSWLAIDEGYAIQAASSLAGPWSLVNVTPSLRDGKLTATVPVGSEHRFFRLWKP